MDDVVAWVEQWCRDRGTVGEVAEAAVAVVREAVAHGLRFGHRSLSLEAGLAAHGRVSLVLTWHGCSRRASAGGAGSSDPQHVADAFDEAAHLWGIDAHGEEAQHWFVIGPSSAPSGAGETLTTDNAEGLATPPH